MKSRVFLIGLVALFCSLQLGCDDDPETLGSLFESLEGKYQLEENDDCYIQIAGSSFQTIDDDGNQSCVIDEDEYSGEDWWGEEYHETYKATLYVDGTLSDDELAGELIYTEIREEDFNDCHRIRTCTSTVDGDLLKEEGKEAEGRFEALAGEWQSDLVFREECETNYSGSDGDYCHEGGYSEWEVERYAARADIDGDSIRIDFWEDGDPVDYETFEIRVLPDGSLTVGDTLVLFE